MALDVLRLLAMLLVRYFGICGSGIIFGVFVSIAIGISVLSVLLLLCVLGYLIGSSVSDFGLIRVVGNVIN